MGIASLAASDRKVNTVAKLSPWRRICVLSSKTQADLVSGFYYTAFHPDNGQSIPTLLIMSLMKDFSFFPISTSSTKSFPNFWPPSSRSPLAGSFHNSLTTAVVPGDWNMAVIWIRHPGGLGHSIHAGTWKKSNRTPFINILVTQEVSGCLKIRV